MLRSDREKGVDGIEFQNQGSGSPQPYDDGQEVIAFVRSAGPNSYLIQDDDPGFGGRHPAQVLLVRDGRVESAPSEFSKYVGMRTAGVLEQLRKLSRRE